MSYKTQHIDVVADFLNGQVTVFCCFNSNRQRRSLFETDCKLNTQLLEHSPPLVATLLKEDDKQLDNFFDCF